MKNKLLWILIALLFIIILSSTLYVAIKLEKIPKPSTKQVIITASIIAAITVITFAILFIRKILKKRSEEEQPKIDQQKQLVATSKATQIWKEAFIMNTGIEYIRKPEGAIEPVNPKAIKIVNEISWHDEHRQTSDKYIGFEAVVTDGERPGVHVVILRIDLGEKNITDNWNQYIRDHKTMNMMKMNFESFPRSSAFDFKERLQMRALDLYEEGYSMEEINLAIPEIGNSARQQSSQPPIKSPKVVETVPIVQAADDDDDDEDSVDKDIEEYRNR